VPAPGRYFAYHSHCKEEQGSTSYRGAASQDDGGQVAAGNFVGFAARSGLHAHQPSEDLVYLVGEEALDVDVAPARMRKHMVRRGQTVEIYDVSGQEFGPLDG